MRIIAVFHKTDGARYISHLDLQRAMQRALRRSHLPVKYTAGFNPHQVMSFATALSLGATSCAEAVDIAMAEPVSEEEFHRRLAPQLPPSLALVEVHAVEDQYPSLTSLLAAADYEIDLHADGSVRGDELSAKIATLWEAPLLAVKKTKAGPKEIDLRPMVLALRIDSAEPENRGTHVRLFLRCVNTSAGALNPDLLMSCLFEKLPLQGEYDVRRVALWADQEGTVPLWNVRKEEIHEA